MKKLYEGEWQHDKRHGYGIMYSYRLYEKYDEVYEGEWYQDK